MRLKTNHGTYVVTDERGEVVHVPIPFKSGLQSVWDGAAPPVLAPGLAEMAITQGALAPSTLVVLTGGLVAFRRNGLYLCADPDVSELRFDRREVGEWECFVIETADGAAIHYAIADPLDHPPSSGRPVLIESRWSYQIMGEGADAALATVTWPEFSTKPINRYALPDGAWIADVDGAPDPDQPFVVYWLYPFDTRIHVWRLNRFGRRMFGYDLSEAQARAFLSSRRALGSAFVARLYMLSQDGVDSGDLAGLISDVCAAAEAGSDDALYAVLCAPGSLPVSTIRRLAARAFRIVRAANRTQADEVEASPKRSVGAALARALAELDPSLRGISQDELQSELDFRDFFSDLKQLPEGASTFPVSLHCRSVEALGAFLDGATSLSIGIVLRPQKKSVEFHYVHSIGGIRQRVIDCLCYAYRVLCIHQVKTWDRLAALDPLAQAWMIRFEVGDMPPEQGRAVAFERRVGDENTVLVPDSYFFSFKGFTQGWFHGDIPRWGKKATRFVWRGSTSGAQNLSRETLAQASRVQLCKHGRKIGSVADFGITGVVQARSEADADDIKLALKAEGLWRDHTPQHIMGANKFLIEIDGNANSWGFFAKLLMGSCVLKVESPFEQWFYGRLQPWVHYIPVARDLSDLSDKVRWCLKHQATCRKIAGAGRRLAKSITFESELLAAADAFLSVAESLPATSTLEAEKNKLLISHVDDIQNIYHLFVGEIDAIWKVTAGDLNYRILLKNYADDPPGRWRFDLLKSLYKDVYISDLPPGMVFDRVHEIKVWTYGMVDNSTFSKINPSPFHIAMADRIKEHFGVRDVRGEKIVYVERGRSRILFDYKTKTLLSDFLSKKSRAKNLPFEIFNFDNATFRSQLESLSNAKILLSCHGAANTNLFLLPKNATLFEVNFRKFWFCDPVCDRHLTGQLPYKSDCGGPLTWKDTFHKAEYHNMAQFYGIGYREFEIEDAQNFLGRNPIELENIFVDGDHIFEEIVAVMRG